MRSKQKQKRNLHIRNHPFYVWVYLLYEVSYTLIWFFGRTWRQSHMGIFIITTGIAVSWFLFMVYRRYVRHDGRIAPDLFLINILFFFFVFGSAEFF